MNRKLRKILAPGVVKGPAVRLMFYALKFKKIVPRFAYVLLLRGAALALKVMWFIPFNPWRSAAANILRLGAAGANPRAVFHALADGAAFVALGFLDSHKYGVESVLPRMRLTEKAERIFKSVAEAGRGAVVVIPHVVGGVFSAALVSRRYPLTVLSRGPRSPGRARIQRLLMAPLEIDLLVIDRKNTVAAARQFLSSLKEGRIIVGMPDLNYHRPDSIETTFFGRRAHLPGWPARYARQGKAPILPGYARVRGGLVEIDLDDPIFENDLTKATRAWAAAFEKMILASPWDWAFLCDLRWGRFLAEAAEALRDVTRIASEEDNPRSAGTR